MTCLMRVAQDLLASTPTIPGIYKALALAVYPGPFQPVSSALVALVLGAQDVSSALTQLQWRLRGKGHLLREGSDANYELPGEAKGDGAGVANEADGGMLAPAQVMRQVRADTLPSPFTP